MEEICAHQVLCHLECIFLNLSMLHTFPNNISMTITLKPYFNEVLERKLRTFSKIHIDLGIARKSCTVHSCRYLYLQNLHQNIYTL